MTREETDGTSGQRRYGTGRWTPQSRLFTFGRVSAVGLGLVVGSVSSAQVLREDAAPQEGQRQQVRIEDLPPPVRLGARAETVRRAWPVLPVVVIVPDASSYLEALAQWRAEARFPVLIDDGSPEAREDVARFVRGFKPRSVVRWKAEEGASAWGGDAAAKRNAVESVIYRVWSCPIGDEQDVPALQTAEDLLGRWARLGIVPPGIVVANVTDTAWTGAVALALGRVQPIAWISSEGQFGGTMSRDGFDRLAMQVEQLAGAVGLTWDAIGDQLDSVTLCLNVPAKVQADGSTILALTDMLGRHREVNDTIEDADQRERPAAGTRWAWTGQIPGNEARAAYSAMCSLFLAPTQAWLFDGYPDEEPWSAYDATAAAEILRQMGLQTLVDDSPHQDLGQWRRRAADGISAGLIAVNTKGNGDEFHLQHGRARPGDVPHLEIPSLIYFVHSFSASSLGARQTVGARWLERGAYAYCGSVHEPYLHGFVPTPIVMARLGAAYPWSAAVRPDDGPAWKIATIGDPLLALGPAAPRLGNEAQLPLERSIELEKSLREHVEARRFAEALTTLSLLGRDDDAARLASALVAERAEALTPEAADAALMPVFRKGSVEVFITVYQRLTPEHAETGWRRDALWHKTHRELATTRNVALVRLLASHLRPDQIGRDAAEVAGPYSRLVGAQPALALLRSARERAATDGDRREIDEAMERTQRSPRSRDP